MPQSEHFRRVLRAIIVAFLCSELQPNHVTQSSKITPMKSAAELNATFATFEDSKHHASIRLKALDERFGDGHICSGALIAPAVVLTSAQCVFDFKKNFQRHPSELRVVLGTRNRYQRTEHSLVHSVTHLYAAPAFDLQSSRDNIALLMLERDVYENSNAEPISIKSDTSLSGQSKVTSWSKTIDDEWMPPLMLLNASLTHDIACQRVYGKAHAQHMICVNFKESCPHDAGSPLLVDDELVGLKSIDSDCTSENVPSIFVDVRHHLEWIQRRIGDGTNQNSSVWGVIAFLILTFYALKTANLKDPRSFFRVQF